MTTGLHVGPGLSADHDVVIDYGSRIGHRASGNPAVVRGRVQDLTEISTRVEAGASGFRLVDDGGRPDQPIRENRG